MKRSSLQHLRKRIHRAPWVALAVAASLSLFGWMDLLGYESPLARLSFDLLSATAPPRRETNIVLVVVDDASFGAESKATDCTLDRRVFIRLLQRLQRDQPKLIFLDFMFHANDPDPSVDRDFASEMTKGGNVVLGALMDRPMQAKAASAQTIPPVEPLQSSCLYWGHLDFQPLDADGAVRRLTTHVMGDDHPSVFISYRRATGSQLALLLRAELERLGIEAWLDDELPPGPFPAEIEREIKCRSCLLLVLTDHAVARLKNPNDWMMIEIAHAYARPSRQIIVVREAGLAMPTTIDFPPVVNAHPINPRIPAELPKLNAKDWRHDTHRQILVDIEAELSLWRRLQNLWRRLRRQIRRVLYPERPRCMR